jgi:peptidyl-prolyl cis-trans isomerase A (cyclophilin A)
MHPETRARKSGRSIWLLPCCLCAAATHLVAAPKVLPVLNKPIADRWGLEGSPLSVDLAKAFGTEAIDDQVVRFTSQFISGEVPLVLDMALFSNRTPVTRTNFLNYVNDGRYVNSIIHRSIPGFVIQGGGFRITESSLDTVTTDPPIINEFGISNTFGTISMAKLGGNPDSATSQWFVSLGPNTDILDPQNSGFTVFGRITKDTLGFAQDFGNPNIFPTFNYGGVLSALPLFYTHNPANGLQIEEFILFPGVSIVPLPEGQAGESTVLEYNVVAISNPDIASASIDPQSHLNISPLALGSTSITVRATDSVGNTVDDSFILTIVNELDTYASWASRTVFPNDEADMARNPDGDPLTNLQEYAFLANPAVADPSALPVLGKTGTIPAPQYLTLRFPIRKLTSGLVYAVEANDSLSGNWTTIWTSTEGFARPQVVSATDQVDRTIVTIKDRAAITGSPTRFLRTRVVQE